jgi:hypothetical protein
MLASKPMTSRGLLGLRSALLLFALLTATGCPPDAPKYAVKVDSPVVKFKPADPDDLVVEEEEEEEPEAEGADGEE